jgi:hypothetical protein
MNSDFLGVACKTCNEEVFRVLEGRCFRCWRGDNLETVEDIEYKAVLPTLNKKAEKHGLWVFPKKRKKSRS